MATRRKKTVGDEIEQQLRDAIRSADSAPLSGARDLPVLLGLKPKGGFSLPQENVLLDAIGRMVASGRVYRHGSMVAAAVRRFDGGGLRLAPLQIGGSVEVGAEDLLGNIILCQHGDDQFAMPKWFVDLLLRSELLIDHIPCIRHYATRPVFDQDFVLRGPGWHPSAGILVHGAEVEPSTTPPDTADGPSITRLPVHLGTLLADFCFRSDADVANAIGLMLTGLLSNHFTTSGKGVALIDGNQSTLGKTLLARVVAIVLDGVDPRLTRFTQDEEEFAKSMCASLRDTSQGMLLIDNAKTRGREVISSPAIEANSTSPEISLRILGKSENFTRPNDVLWVLTMNDTRASADLIARSFPIQLFFEGVPENRKFHGADPLACASEHRIEILGELAGMVVQWDQRGRPAGRQSHRLNGWASTIGGILEVAGLPEFLGNVTTAAASFNSELDHLAAVAEAVLKETEGPHVVQGKMPLRTLVATGWEPHLRKAEVLVEELSGCKSERARAIRIGQFLSPKVDREVAIQVRGRTGRATLRLEKRRANEKAYFFEVLWDVEATAGAKKIRPKEKTLRAAKTATRDEVLEHNNVKKPVRSNPRFSGKVKAGNNEKW